MHQKANIFVKMSFSYDFDGDWHLATWRAGHYVFY